MAGTVQQRLGRAQADGDVAQARDEQRARQRSAEPKVHRVAKARPAREDAGAGEAQQADAPAAALPQVEGEEGAAPKKRRRRRRKPQGGGDGAVGGDD